MNAIVAVYLDTQKILCWWHVLYAIWTHFCMEQFLELWEHTSTWVKTDG